MTADTLDQVFSFHPLANVFPLIEGSEFDALVTDIKANGLNDHIVVHENQILDGRNRYRACKAADVDPVFTPFLGDDPLAFVISANLRRRHLDESQRAMVAAKLATLTHGTNQWTGQLAAPTQEQAAGMLNVGERSLRRAREVIDHGAPELQQAVERGEVSVSAAADIVTLPVPEQAEIVARGERDILRAARVIRARKSQSNHAERVKRIEATCSSNSDLPTQRRYPVILADPPWDDGVESKSVRATAEHYPTMPLDEICAVKVADLASDAAVLFMWTTSTHLQESFEVLKAWGFEYASDIVWVKEGRPELGHWVRNQHETLIIARRGDIPAPLPANLPRSVIQAPRRDHSQKPDEAYEIIERMYPDLPKIELFARNAREGWARWGNQAAAEPDEALPEIAGGDASLVPSKAEATKTESIAT